MSNHQEGFREFNKERGSERLLLLPFTFIYFFICSFAKTIIKLIRRRQKNFEITERFRMLSGAFVNKNARQWKHKYFLPKYPCDLKYVRGCLEVFNGIEQ